MKSKSDYASKVSAGNQMYGPGCCAHKVTQSQVDRVRDDAKRRGHFRAPVRADDEQEDLGFIGGVSE